MAWPLSLAMCPQRLVHRDGNVSGTNDHDGMTQGAVEFSPVLLELEFYCFGVIPALVEIRTSDGQIFTLATCDCVYWFGQRVQWALVICKPSSYPLLSWSTCCAVNKKDAASWKKPKLLVKSLGGYCPSFHDEMLVVIWLLEASILHFVGNLVGNFSCHFCSTQALRWERLRKLSDYCIVHSLNALSDYSFSILLSDRVCESQLHCESD